MLLKGVKFKIKWIRLCDQRSADWQSFGLDWRNFLPDKTFLLKVYTNFIRTGGLWISTLGALINKVLISERRERLSFSGGARKICK